MSFRNIKDQTVAIRLLGNMLQRGRIPNAVLFWGPDGVGKRTTAMELAKAVNCRDEVADACDTCLSCRKVTNCNHPDVNVVTPLKKSRIIDVEAINTINEFASLRAFESEWRVFVVLDADRMGLPAQNHFLKTLEEPPGKSLFILVTGYPGLLLPTIRSRCQMIRFSALRPETVADYLQSSRDVPPAEAGALARLSQGQLSRAVDLLESETREIVLDVTRRLAAGEDPLELAEAFTSSLKTQRDAGEDSLEPAQSDDAEAMSREDKAAIKEERMALLNALGQRNKMEYLYLFATWYRDALVYDATGESTHVLNGDQVAQLASQTGSNAGKKIMAVEKARVYLERFISEDRVFRDLFFALAE